MRCQTALIWAMLWTGVFCCGCRQTGPAWPEEVTRRSEVEQGISCHLYLPSSKTASSAMLPVYVLVANQGSQTTYLDGRLNEAAHISLVFATPKGQVLPWPAYRAKVTRAQREDFVAIRPGFVYGRVIQVPIRELGGGVEGRYRLVALLEEWDDGQRFGLKAWTGYVRSGEVSFRVEGH